MTFKFPLHPVAGNNGIASILQDPWIPPATNSAVIRANPKRFTWNILKYVGIKFSLKRPKLGPLLYSLVDCRPRIRHVGSLCGYWPSFLPWAKRFLPWGRRWILLALECSLPLRRSWGVPRLVGLGWTLQTRTRILLAWCSLGLWWGATPSTSYECPRTRSHGHPCRQQYCLSRCSEDDKYRSLHGSEIKAIWDMRDDKLLSKPWSAIKLRDRPDSKSGQN